MEGIVQQLVQRLGMATKQIEERDIFDDQIVALLDQIETCLKGIETLGRGIAQPLAQLIDFEKMRASGMVRNAKARS